MLLPLRYQVCLQSQWFLSLWKTNLRNFLSILSRLSNTYLNLGVNSLFLKGKTWDFVLPKARRTNEFILVAKFLTIRALNMDAVGRTFKQLQRCNDGFRIHNLNDHKALFVFDDEHDVNQIFLSEPWSFDKHLVVFHDIPFRFMTASFQTP